MAEYLISRNSEFTKIRMANDRVDVATEDFSEFLFFSLENFGLQIEASPDFGEFRNKIDDLFRILRKFDKYPIKSLIRVGTKSLVLNYRSADNLENIKTRYKEKMFKNYASFETYTNSKILDFGYTFNDCERSEGKYNFQTGPVSAEEAFTRFFENKKIYPENFKRDCGTFCSIDFYQNKEMVLDPDQLLNLCKSNVNAIEEIHNGFLTYFYE